MFKNTSKRKSHLPFLRLYFLEFVIFLSFCLLSMVGIFYYFKHHPQIFSEQNKKVLAVNEGSLKSQVVLENEPEFEFYSLLAAGDTALPANLVNSAFF